jgi:prepilin-type N-terminal cleavage/methylation domain-containing protein
MFLKKPIISFYSFEEEPMKYKLGFTMIELIIVTSIIGILAAIAIPNFLAARTRAKVSRVRAEQEMLMVALQSYFADKTTYPMNYKKGIPSDIDLMVLTTPIAYITRLPQDLFQFPELRDNRIAGPYLKKREFPMDIRFGGYGYINYLQMIAKKGEVPKENPFNGNNWYILLSLGPDYKLDYDASKIPNTYISYDPTNGTTSEGDIWLTGP